MPNFDGGHYFLTVLAPVRTDVLETDDGGVCSPINKLNRALSVLPTALQSPATEKTGIKSPFSGSLRTHLARFVIVTDVVFNGRTPQNSLKVALRGPNPVIAQPVDQLPCPYLLFVADFDARSGAESELRSYLDELWQAMGPELTSIFSACQGFRGVESSAAFQAYILKCQIETTMPFNDYWIVPPPFPSMSKLALLGPPAAAAFITLVAFVINLFLPEGKSLLGLIVFGLIALAATLGLSYWLVMKHGAKPFPAAPNSDLRSILKALYLQQRFTRFAIDMQGRSPQELYDAFGQFVATHRPSEVAAPTQAPGVVRS